MASVGSRKATEKAKRGITRNSMRDGEVIASKLHPDVKSCSHLFYQGKGQPLLFLADLSGVAAGTDNVGCIAVLPSKGHHIYYTPIGTVTTAPFGPTADAAGLDLSLDQTNNEGVNYVIGGLLGPWLLTVKRDISDPIPRGMFIRLKCKIPDVSGTDDFGIGFRKNEAVQAAIDDYADAAWLNVISGNVNRESMVGGAATVTVDTALDWADNETHEVMVVCQGNGKVTFFFDGAPAPTGAAYQFTEDLAVVPFIYFLQDTDLTPVNVIELEVGFLEQIGK
jgi:hypothetical protein